VEWSFFTLILVATCSVALGVCAAVINTWSLRSRLFSLEDQVAVMQGTLQREVKTRAGQERWKKPSLEEQMLLAGQTITPPQKKFNWWENPALKRGAYEK
jgi:hypothetical protein